LGVRKLASVHEVPVPVIVNVPDFVAKPLNVVTMKLKKPNPSSFPDPCVAGCAPSGYAVLSANVLEKVARDALPPPRNIFKPTTPW
jgi:hypothetical protein